MSLSLVNITMDCKDAAAQSAFWSAVLGLPVDDGAVPQFATIGRDRPGGRPRWLFIQVPETKVAKNRLHVDFHGDDREADVARLVALGATKVDEHDEHGIHWAVMNDPEGNEFCVA